MPDLSRFLEQGPYQSYAYAYPHKTSYRAFEAPQDVGEVWANEDQSALFLYLHIPFCEMRCGFCNLFTMAQAKDELQAAYLDALQRQVLATREQLPHAEFARLAIGGGTPTMLTDSQLARLFDLVETMGARPLELPVSVEMSPETITPSKLAILKERGVTRASVGIQSFLEDETKAVRRAQTPALAHAALDMMRNAGFQTMNLDLIYGMAGQTNQTFENSIHEALKHAPEEIYLYPLYVRPLTGLGKSKQSWDDHRMGLYRHGRDLLLKSGYEQVSMRMFRRTDTHEAAGPVYCCQSDGMLGLGVGARSYTSQLHYCSEYAVGRSSVKGIIENFVERDATTLAQVDYGIALTTEEQKRRHLILSLLSHEGLRDDAYAMRFRSQPMDDFPELIQLVEHELAQKADSTLMLTQRGIDWSDAIGPWLFSDEVQRRSAEYELK